MPTEVIIKRYLCDFCSSMFDVSYQCKIHEARDHSSQEIQAALERNKTYRKYKLLHLNGEPIINGDASNAEKRRISAANDDLQIIEPREKRQRTSPPMTATAGDTNGSNSSMLHRKTELLLRNMEARSVNATVAPTTNSWQDEDDASEEHLDSLMQNSSMLNQSYFDESQDPANEDHEDDRPDPKHSSKNKPYPLTRLISGKTQCDLCQQKLTQRSNAIRHLRLKHHYVNDDRGALTAPTGHYTSDMASFGQQSMVAPTMVDSSHYHRSFDIKEESLDHNDLMLTDAANGHDPEVAQAAEL